MPNVKTWLLLPVVVSGAIIWSGQYRLQKPRHAPSSTHSEHRLVAVQVFHRHGDRTPVTVLNKDTQKERNLWIPKIAKFYTPVTIKNVSTPNNQLFSWLSIATRLRNTHLVHRKDDIDNWRITTETDIIDTRLPEKNSKRLKELSTWDAHYSELWMGQLTETGVDQLHNVGRFLRKRYIEDMGWLSPHYNGDTDGTQPQLHVQSTNFCRTLFSADSVLQTLYPSQSRQSSIPINVETKKTFFYPNAHICPRIASVHKRNRKWLAANKDNAYLPMKSQIATFYNREPNEVRWISLAESLICRLTHNIDLPNGLSTMRIREFAQYALWRIFHIYAHDRESLRISAGCLLFKLMQSCANDSNVFRVMSVHDNTVVLLLLALTEKFDIGWPTYAAHLIFEVWESESDGERFVKILYCGEPLSVDGSELISIRRLQHKWSDLMVDENTYLNKECIC